MIDKIRNDIQYKQVMAIIDAFLKKATDLGGFHNLKKKEADELHHLTILVQSYEDEVLKIMPLPVTISTIVRQKVEELNITQKQLAIILNIASSKLSQILNGKRAPDVPFLKAVHEKLGIDGNLILDRV